MEIRPAPGPASCVTVSLVTIALIRRETIHPSADSVTKKHLAAPRKEITDIVGKEMLLFRSPAGKEFERVLSMDLPFVLFIPVGRGGEEIARRVPPASLSLHSRTAETFYELVVTVQQSHQEQRKYAFPVPISRYDTLSTFGMFNRPETVEKVSEHMVTLGINLPRRSYGPLDPVSVYIKLSPNPDRIAKAKRVTIQKITIAVEEEITYNHEGDEPSKKVNRLAKQTQAVGIKMPEAGYLTNLGLVYPAKDLRDADGIVPRGKPAFPMYTVTGFTTTGSLYKIEYYIVVKVHIIPTDAPIAIKTLMTAIGTPDRSQGHHDPTAHRGMSLGPRRLQRGNGRREAGRQGCGSRQRRQPAAGADHRSSSRSQRLELVGFDHGRESVQAADRMNWVDPRPGLARRPSSRHPHDPSNDRPSHRWLCWSNGARSIVRSSSKPERHHRSVRGFDDRQRS